MGKRKGKKIFAAILMAAMAASLAGCSSSSSMSADTAYDGETGYAAADYELDDTEDLDIESESSTETTTDISEEDLSGSEETYEQKLIRTVYMSVETTEFDSLIDTLEKEAKSLGGYIESSEISSPSYSSSSRWGNIVYRIPAESLDTFTAIAGEEASVTYTSESTEDVTLSYVDLESYLEALRAEQESLLSMLEEADTTDAVISIQSQLTSVRYEIESAESQLRVYDNQVNYSTVTISINEVERESAAATASFWGSVKERFGNNAFRVGRGFKNFAIAFLGAIPVLLAIFIPIAIILLLVRKAVRKRKGKKEEMSASGRFIEQKNQSINRALKKRKGEEEE